MTHPYLKPAFTLQNALECNLLVKVRCQLCKSVHRYFPADLLQLCGDISLDQIGPWFRCEKCETREYMRADWQDVRGPDVGKVKVRRLVQIRMVRIPEWQEEIV